MLPEPPTVNFAERAMSVLRFAQASAGAEGMAEIATGHVLRPSWRTAGSRAKS